MQADKMPEFKDICLSFKVKCPHCHEFVAIHAPYSPIKVGHYHGCGNVFNYWQRIKVVDSYAFAVKIVVEKSDTQFKVGIKPKTTKKQKLF
jgi:hypothetical protein